MTFRGVAMECLGGCRGRYHAWHATSPLTACDEILCHAMRCRGDIIVSHGWYNPHPTNKPKSVEPWENLLAIVRTSDRIETTPVGKLAILMDVSEVHGGRLASDRDRGKRGGPLNWRRLMCSM